MIGKSPSKLYRRVIFEDGFAVFWCKLIPRLITKNAVIFAISMLGLFLIHSTIARLPVDVASQSLLGMYVQAWLVIFLSAILATYLVIKDEETAGVVTAFVIGMFLSGVVLLLLKGTAYSLNGDHGDQGLLIAQITKFSLYAPVDFVYKELPPFYPPLYAFVLGKISSIVGIAPYKMVKYGLVAIVFITPYLLRRSWRTLLDSHILILIPFILLVFQNWYKPQEWLSLLLFVPWWLVYVEGAESSDLPKVRRYITGGLIGAALFQTYYYWFFVGIASLLTGLVLRRFFLKSTAWSVALRESIFILVGTALFSVMYWGPLLLSAIKAGGVESLQNRYYLPEFGLFQFPFLELSLFGGILFCGLVYLVYSARASRVSYLLLNLLLAAYVWQFVGALAFYLNTPLLTFKTRDLIVYLLCLGALLGIGEIWKVLKIRFKNRYFKLATHILVLPALLYFAATGIFDFINDPLRERAFSTLFPASIVQSYEMLTKNKPQNQTVMGANENLSMYSPAFDFLAWAAHFSHPAALFHDRVNFVNLLALSEDPDCFAFALIHNRYAKIDHILVTQVGSEYQLSYLDDAFPNGSKRRTILFPAELLDSPYFERTKGDSWFFFTPINGINPVEGSAGPVLEACADQFAGHLKSP